MCDYVVLRSCFEEKHILPPIENKCRQFCTSLVQSLYYIPDSYFRSERVVNSSLFMSIGLTKLALFLLMVVNIFFDL
jgi:hypothetical protein